MQTPIQIVINTDHNIILSLYRCLELMAQNQADISGNEFHTNRMILDDIQDRILRDNMTASRQYPDGWMRMMMLRSFHTDIFFDLDRQFTQTPDTFEHWILRSEILRAIAINEQFTCNAQARILNSLGHVQDASSIQRQAAAGFQLARVNQLCDNHVADLQMVIEIKSKIAQLEN